MPVLRGLKSGSEDVNLAFNRFGTALLGGNAKAVELAQTMATLSKSERDAAAASSALSEAQDRMAKGRVTTRRKPRTQQKQPRRKPKRSILCSIRSTASRLISTRTTSRTSRRYLRNTTKASCLCLASTRVFSRYEQCNLALWRQRLNGASNLKKARSR